MMIQSMMWLNYQKVTQNSLPRSMKLHNMGKPNQKSKRVVRVQAKISRQKDNHRRKTWYTKALLPDIKDKANYLKVSRIKMMKNFLTHLRLAAWIVKFLNLFNWIPLDLLVMTVLARILPASFVPPTWDPSLTHNLVNSLGEIPNLISPWPADATITYNGIHRTKSHFFLIKKVSTRWGLKSVNHLHLKYPSNTSAI